MSFFTHVHETTGRFLAAALLCNACCANRHQTTASIESTRRVSQRFSRAERPIWMRCLSASSLHLEATSFAIFLTNRRYCRISFHTGRSGEWGACESGWEFKGVKNRTKGRSVRPNLKPHGPRWAAQCPLRPGPPRTSERVYTPRVYYNHLLQEKQALFFEAAAKKKPLLPPSRSERHIQTVSLPQPQSPTTGWLRKTERKMTGDKLWGGKGFAFSLNQMKGLGTWISQLATLKQRSSVCHAKPLSWRRPSLLSVGWNLKKTTAPVECVANLRSDSSVTVFIRYSSGHKLSGSTGGACTCRWICWGRRDSNERKHGGK